MGIVPCSLNAPDHVTSATAKLTSDSPMAEPNDLKPDFDRASPTPTQPGLDADTDSISARALAHSRKPDYLDGLNPEQRRAVETTEGPVLVLAGAGTGKTRVLTTRIAHILATGRARPGDILAVTFTNKAAREMKHRIGQYVGGAVEGMPWLGTFHSIGVKILRRHAELAGLKSGFTILDPDDQLRLMKQVIEAANIDKDRWPARQLANLIDTWKNRGLAPADVPKGEAFAFGNGRGSELYAAYQTRLKELNACDFGDLLLECVRLFRNHPDVLAQYQRRFRYMLVDEYQDTNVVQYLWLRLLSQGTAERGGPPNLCCVGDDDQSIYGWRGAEVDNILRFETDFPGAAVIRLERNYRSTGHILAAAAGVIAHNESRLGKTLFTDGAAGEKVTVLGVWDDEEEARAVVEDIEAAQQRGQALNEIAILVRASYQMRALEDRFITVGLPYRVIGGPRFYERAEIKDAIAYLEIVYNPANDLKFERIVNVPKRGLGDTSVRKVRDLARARQIPIYHAARQIVETDELSAKARKSLSGLIADFERWRGQLDAIKHTELAELILDESGYTAMWQADKSPQAQTRLENLKELVRFMHDFDTLAGFLEHISLVMDADQSNDGDRVTLMTLHAAKGLEFETVFLTGWEEGLFPSQRTMDESGLAGLEEERRLAYVGITRAKRESKISFTQNRRTRGLFQAATPSRFVDELPSEHVSVLEPRSPFGGAYQTFGGGNFRNPFGASRFDQAQPGTPRSGHDPSELWGNTQSYQTPGWQRAAKRTGQQAQPLGRAQPSGQAQAQGKARAQSRRRAPLTIEGELVVTSASSETFTIGARVTHPKFGSGSVVEVEGNKLTVEFDEAGRKRVVDSYVDAA